MRHLSRKARRRFLKAASVSLALLLAGCTSAVGPPRFTRSATISAGTGTIVADVAETPERRSYGLQGHRSLAANEGMLFVFDPSSEVTFARKAVPFPLDVVFIADGRVVDVSRLDTGHPRAPSPGPVAFVVEVRQGWSREHGVEEGSPVTISMR